MAKDATSTPRIAVVIPHLNQCDALRRCLAALARGPLQPDQVIVADNGSDQLPPESLWSCLDNTTLISVAEPGPGPARNAGVALCENADLLAFVDADCVPADDWLEKIAAAHLETPTAILGGDVRIGPHPPAGPVAAYEAVYAYRMDRYIAQQGFTGAGNMAVPHAIWAAVGPFAGIDVAEDRDWGHRAVALGHAIRFVPQMRVHHPARPSFDSLRRKWDRQIAHDWAANAGHPSDRLRWIAKALALPLSPVAEVGRLLTTDRLTGTAMRFNALRGLCSIRWHRATRMIQIVRHPDQVADLAAAWNRA